MTVLASKIMNRAEEILYDTGNTTWVEATLFDWLNVGQREIVKLKPDSYTDVCTYQLVAGAVQSVDTGSISVLEPLCNMGTDGLTEGNAITLIEKVVLDALIPSWRSDTQDDEIQHIALDERMPGKYLCYPPNDGTGYISNIEALLPADVVAGAGPDYDVAITLDDKFENDLFHFILAMSYAKDSAHSMYGKQNALTWYNAFVNGLGRMDLQEKITSPYISRFQQSRTQNLPTV